MNNRVVNVLGALTLFCSFCHGAGAQQIPDAIINVDGIGFARMIDDELVVFDLVAAYDEHMIVEANCSAFKSQGAGRRLVLLQRSKPVDF